MSRRHLASSLGTLVDLREREVDRLAADMASKEALRRRFRHNIERLRGLCAGESAPASLPMALSLNLAGYKQSVLRMVEQHCEDLALHEADMAVTQQALTAASQRREVLEQVLRREQRAVRIELGVREQKRQDELASQVWWRSGR